VFNDLPTLHKLVKEYCIGKEEEGWKKKDKDKNKPEEEKDNSPGVEAIEEEEKEVDAGIINITASLVGMPPSVVEAEVIKE